MNAQQWLTRVIRMRNKLIRDNKSHKNFFVVNDLVFLERHLAANRYTDLTFAAFFVRHSDKIFNILPGEGAGNHKKLLQEFWELCDECKTITTKQTI